MGDQRRYFQTISRGGSGAVFQTLSGGGGGGGVCIFKQNVHYGIKQPEDLHNGNARTGL